MTLYEIPLPAAPSVNRLVTLRNDGSASEQAAVNSDSAKHAPAVFMSAASIANFGRRPLVETHTLHRSDLFTDDALIDLLNQVPRQYLHALTMGNDPTRPDENRVAINDGVSGANLLQAVKNGRLWLNITRVDRFDRRYRELIDHLYAQLAAQIPGFAPDFSQGTLLVSSPRALVYYHVDGPASVLWHLRGYKRVWVYPALDARYVKRHELEDIFAGVRHEYLPFDSAYDEGATVYDLEPGQWAAWPQNAPHRVTNFDSVNVSLSTEHFTRESRRRARVFRANRFFRMRFGLQQLSAREQGAGAVLKTAAHFAARKLGLDATQVKRHTATLRVDPNAPDGVLPLTQESTAGQVRD